MDQTSIPEEYLEDNFQHKYFKMQKVCICSLLFVCLFLYVCVGVGGQTSYYIWRDLYPTSHSEIEITRMTRASSVLFPPCPRIRWTTVESWPYQLLVELLWESCLAILSLRFLIYKMRRKIVS